MEKKGLTMDFSDSVVACDIKVDIRTFSDTKGQCHLLIFILFA